MIKAKYKKLHLESFEIKTGGGMSGIHEVLKVGSDTSKNIVTVYKSVSYLWNSNPKAELYIVDSILLDEIKKVFIEKKLYNAKKLPFSKMQVLDADTTHYNTSFSDGSFITYSTNQILSSKIHKANNQIKAIIDKYCENATACPTVYSEEEEGCMFCQEKEGITVECTNNSPFCINLNIYNCTSNIVELTGNVTISKTDGNRVIYTNTLMENYKTEVYGQSDESISITLPFDSYPDEGRYKMEYAGYETVFKMKVYKIS